MVSEAKETDTGFATNKMSQMSDAKEMKWSLSRKTGQGRKLNKVCCLMLRK